LPRAYVGRQLAAHDADFLVDSEETGVRRVIALVISSNRQAERIEFDCRGTTPVSDY